MALGRTTGQKRRLYLIERIQSLTDREGAVGAVFLDLRKKPLTPLTIRPHILLLDISA